MGEHIERKALRKRCRFIEQNADKNSEEGAAMIDSLDFMDIAERIEPFVLMRHLTNTGWYILPTKKTYMKIFQWEDEADFYQVTIPIDKTLGDYKEAMYKAVETTSRKENRPMEQLTLRLLNPNADILKIRIDKPGTEMGNILFDDAIRLYENARKLIAAAAMDIIKPQVCHEGKIDDTVLRLLADFKFGQTEPGGYVVSMVCPFAEWDAARGYRQLSIFSSEERCAESLTRKVTNQVMKNSSMVKKCVEEGNTQKLTGLKDQDVISADFIEALSGLNLEFERTSVELIAEWSPVVKNKQHVPGSILLTHDYYQPMTTVAERLKKGIPYA